MDKYHDMKMKSYGPNVQVKNQGPAKHISQIIPNPFILIEEIHPCPMFVQKQGVRRVMVMVLYATFNNISVISWQSVLFVE